MTLYQILTKALMGKGITYSLQFGDLNGFPLYATSLYKEREVKFLKSDILLEDVRNFIIDNSDLLWENDHAVGIWESGNFIYLDVVKTFRKDCTTEDEIQKLLIEHSQEAAWDLEHNLLIPRRNA